MIHPLFTPQQSWRKDMSHSFIERWLSMIMLNVGAAVLRMAIEYSASEAWSDVESKWREWIPSNLRVFLSRYIVKESSIGYVDVFCAILALLFTVSLALVFESRLEISNKRVSDFFSQLLVYVTCGAACIGGFGSLDIVFCYKDWFVGTCILIAYDALLAWLQTYGLRQHVQRSTLEENLDNRAKFVEWYSRWEKTDRFSYKYKKLAMILGVFTCVIMSSLFWVCCIVHGSKNMRFDCWDIKYLGCFLFFGVISVFYVSLMFCTVYMYGPILMIWISASIADVKDKIAGDKVVKSLGHRFCSNNKTYGERRIPWKMSWADHFIAVLALLLHLSMFLVFDFLYIVAYCNLIENTGSSISCIPSLVWCYCFLFGVVVIFMLYFSHRFLIFYEIKWLRRSVRNSQRVIERQHYELFQDCIVRADYRDSHVNCYLDLLYRCLIPLYRKNDVLSGGDWGWVRVCYPVDENAEGARRSSVCCVPLLSLSSDELNKWFGVHDAESDRRDRCLALCRACKLSAGGDAKAYIDISPCEEKVAFRVFCYYLYVLFDDRMYLSVEYPEVPDVQNSQRSQGFGCIVPQLLRNIVRGLFSR